MPISVSPSSLEVDEVPVEPRAEPQRKAGGDVGGENRLREQHRVEALVADERREHVDPRLRERRGEALVVGGEDHRAAEAARSRGRFLHARADDDPAGLAAEPRGPREHAERRLRDRAVVVLEEDERLHRQPPLDEELDDLLGRRRAVLEPATVAALRRRRRARSPWSAPAWTPPTSAEPSVSCGFDFAPMIPLSDG